MIAPVIAPIKVGDHLALDFLNSIASPKGKPVEWLPNGVEMMRWEVENSLLTEAVANQLAASVPQEELDQVARQATELREWFRELLPKVKESGLSEDDLRRLNKYLALDTRYRRVEKVDGRLKLTLQRNWREGAELLGPLVESIAELLCEANLELVRRCENPECTLWFYDRTKTHRRRWCSQALCGNRAKVAAFRERQKG